MAKPLTISKTDPREQLFQILWRTFMREVKTEFSKEEEIREAKKKAFETQPPKK